jgi:hypothetical protein
MQNIGSIAGVTAAFTEATSNARGCADAATAITDAPINASKIGFLTCPLLPAWSMSKLGQHEPTIANESSFPRQP